MQINTRLHPNTVVLEQTCTTSRRSRGRGDPADGQASSFLADVAIPL